MSLHCFTSRLCVSPVAKQSEDRGEGASSALCRRWADPYLLGYRLKTPQGTWLKATVGCTSRRTSNWMWVYPDTKMLWRFNKCDLSIVVVYSSTDLRSQTRRKGRTRFSNLNIIKCWWKQILFWLKTALCTVDLSYKMPPINGDIRKCLSVFPNALWASRDKKVTLQ